MGWPPTSTLTGFVCSWGKWRSATQLAAIRLILIGLGLILFLIYRPQGFMAEYRLKSSSIVGAPPPERRDTAKS